jgi:CRP-like cAMP-binding protein
MFEKFGRVFKPNQIIFSEYEPGEDFFLLQQGRVKITKIINLTEKTLDILNPGDIFGEMAIIESAPRSATAVAVDEVKVLNFNKQNFEMLLQSNTALAIKLLKLFAKRIYDAKRKLMILSLTDDDAKVADAIIMLAEHKGYNPGEIREIVEPLEIEATYQDIANWCALAHDDAKSILEQFIKMNRVSMGPSSIVVKNINELSRFVNQKRKQADF